MNKYLIMILIILVIYYLIKCWNMKVENFTQAEQPIVVEQSVTGVDNLNAINTLANIAKQLMDGGLTIPGNISVTKNVSTDSIKIKNKWLMGGTGGGSGDDEWIRITDINNKAYYGGLAAGKLWTGDNTINGRNIFTEIDDLKTTIQKMNESITNINNTAIFNNQKISAKPLYDINRCFDFGSQGRTDCNGNSGWSTIQIYKR
jgi:hypothetical protein